MSSQDQPGVDSGLRRKHRVDRSSRIVVLHVLEDLGTAGAERQLAAFILRSDVTRFQHEVCVFSEAGRFAAGLQDAGVRVHRLGGGSDKSLVQCFVRLRRLVREIDPDILHASLYRPGVVSRAVARLYGKPVVTTLVNTTYEPEWLLDNPRLTPWKVWLTRAVDGLTARSWGTRFIAISESVRASAVRQLGLLPDRISVIPRGLTFDEYAGPTDADVLNARAALGWGDTYPLILNVGRLVPQKAQRYAILAMRHVVARFPTARLIIAGEGRLRPALEQLIRSERLENHVTLLGERQDVDVLLKVADIFVFPSLYEGLGNALLEAMAAGKPCVVSRIATLREVTGDGAAGLLADIQSPEDLAAKLLWLAEDRERGRQLGERAHDWVRARYDIRGIVAALESLYQRISFYAPAGVREARV